jgi:hypothetical protein
MKNKKTIVRAISLVGEYVLRKYVARVRLSDRPLFIMAII